MNMKTVVLILVSFVCFKQTLYGDTSLDLFLTTNIEGRYSTAVEKQDTEDFILLLAQNLLQEQANNKGLIYVDIGNAFYPGALSRYGMGSPINDFFSFMKCKATLVSSADVRLGIDNLLFFQKEGKTLYLSSSLYKDNKTVFTPYFIEQMGTQKIAFLALSSSKILINMAEKKYFNIEQRNNITILQNYIQQLKTMNVQYIVLLTGTNTRETVELLNRFHNIDLAICGGDNRGNLYSGSARSITMSDNRKVLMLSANDGYYLLNLSMRESRLSSRLVYKKVRPYTVQADRYRELVNRISIWKNKYNTEESKTLLELGDRKLEINKDNVMALMRNRYRAEVAVVSTDTLRSTTVHNNVKRYDLYQLTGDETELITYYLSPAQLATVYKHSDIVEIQGYDGKRIQGYIPDQNRKYKVVSTRAVHNIIAHSLLQQELDFENQWVTINDCVVDDLKQDRYLLQEDTSYVDRRFRSVIDLYLSAFYDNSSISSSDTIETPPGEPSVSYNKWGVEAYIDYSFYNNFHQFRLTPYIYYVEQEIDSDGNNSKDYLKNILRGTFIYSMNFDYFAKPYHKSLCESVVREVDGQRPVLLRETVGVNVAYLTYVEGLVGIGFEKMIHDPVDSPFYGLEAVLKVSYTFWDNFIYSMAFDSFFSKGFTSSNGSSLGGYQKISIENSISYQLNQFLKASIKHRYYYFNTIESDESYKDSQVVFSIDMKTQFKLY